MATCINETDYRSKLAGEDLSSSQYRFVTLETDDQLDLGDSTSDNPYGVLQDAPESGEAASVKVSGETKVVAAEALAVGNIVACDAAGAAAIAASTHYPKGVVVSAAGAADDLAVIQLITAGVPLA